MAFIRGHPAAGLGAAAATRGRIDVKRLIVLRPIENQGRGVPSCRGFGIAKILRKRQLHPRQGCIRWMSE
jgi:hypothetical protein